MVRGHRPPLPGVRCNGVERRRRAPLRRRFPPSPPHTGQAPFSASGVPIRLPCGIFAASTVRDVHGGLLPPASHSISPVCLDPFALWQLFSASLDGRHATDYYGSAAPAGTLATCPPTRMGVSAGSGVACRAISPSAVGAFLIPLLLASQAGKRALADEWFARFPGLRNRLGRGWVGQEILPNWLPPPD